MPATATSVSPQLAYHRRKYPGGKINYTSITVGGKTYNLPSIKRPDNWRQFLKLIQDWKKNPTAENFVGLLNKLTKGGKETARDFRKWLGGEHLGYGERVSGDVTTKVFEAINKDLDLSESQVSKLRSYVKGDPEYNIQLSRKGSIASALRTHVQKGTNDFPEIVKIFDKYKANTNLTKAQNQSAILDLLKKNPIIAERFKQKGVPLTLKNLKTRIARTHNAVIKNSIDKKSYGDLFKDYSLADRQNFLNTSQRLFDRIIFRSFQGQLLDTLKGNELKLAADKYRKFSYLKQFLGQKMGEVGAKSEAFIQMDHPISLSALEKSGNLNQALRVNPIAGDINIWKRKLDQRLNTLQKNKDVKGLRALNEINQVLFGKGSPTITAGAEGISKIKGLPADFRKIDLLAQLRENVTKGDIGLHETLKENIKTVRPDAWTEAGFTSTTKGNVFKELEALKSWDPAVLTRHINEWTDKNPKWTKIIEKRIGCQSGCLAAAANESPAAFSEVLKKTPAAARSFLGMLGKFGAKAAPLAALAAVGAGIEPLVKQFVIDDPSTYLTDEGQMKGMLLATIEGETPKVDEEILKWQLPVTAAGAASAVPGSGALYEARRLPTLKRAAMGVPRAALGPLGKAFAGTFSPLAAAISTPLHIAAQRKGGTEWGDIATDPTNWMGAAFASTGARMATRGMNPTGILSKALRLGYSPRVLRAFSSKLGWPGLMITGGMWGYDKWKNRSINDED